MQLPDPRIDYYDVPLPAPGLRSAPVGGSLEVAVVRDDLIPGGSKVRFLPVITEGADELVFGGPFCGGAPLALAAIGAETGQQVTLFYAARNQLHRRQLAAQRLGARIEPVPYGRIAVVQKAAREYASSVGALFLPLGFDTADAEEPFVKVMTEVRSRIERDPDEVWCATGSGMLARCLGEAFPMSRIRAVGVGLRSRWEVQQYPPNVEVIEHRLDFAQESKQTAPFPICPNYEAKAWEIMLAEARGRVLFWNVIGNQQ